MNNRGDFEEFSRITGFPTPTAEERELARERLRMAMADPRSNTVRRQRRLVPVAAAISAVAVVVALSMFGNRSDVNASLLRLVDAAERVEQVTLAPGQATHVIESTTYLMVIAGDELGIKTEVIAYLLPATRELWILPDRTVILHTTVGRPLFFDELVEDAYYEAEYDAVDKVGTTIEDAYTGVADIVREHDWPTNPGELKADILDQVRQGGSALPEEALIFQRVARIYRTHETTPQLRGALLEVLASLDVTVLNDPDSGTVSASISYPDMGGTLSDLLTFDTDGLLIAEQTTADTGIPGLGIPPGTVIASATYTVPETVDWSPGG